VINFIDRIILKIKNSSIDDIVVICVPLIAFVFSIAYVVYSELLKIGCTFLFDTIKYIDIGVSGLFISAIIAGVSYLLSIMVILLTRGTINISKKLVNGDIHVNFNFHRFLKIVGFTFVVIAIVLKQEREIYVR
jgi:hypothetical protein